MALTLSNGVISEIHHGARPFDIKLQVLALQMFPTGDRCLLLVSDGTHSSGNVILASQLIHLVTSGKLAQHSVMHITRYLFNEFPGNRKFLIILEVTELWSAAEMVGNPQSYDMNAALPAAAVPAAARPLPAPPAQEVRHQPPNTGGGAGGGSQKPAGWPDLCPINSLPLGCCIDKTICARVITKGGVFKGKFFKMELLDESCEILVTTFKREINKLYQLFEPNNVYYIRGFVVLDANKKYYTKNEHEIQFNSTTQVEQCHDEASVPAIPFNFVALDELQHLPVGSDIDVVAVCLMVQELASTRDNSKKRDITLVDPSNWRVRMTLWSETAEKFDGSGCPVLAIKNARLSDYDGVSLNYNCTAILVNHDISEVHQLRDWWREVGSNSSDLTSLAIPLRSHGGSPADPCYNTLHEVRSLRLGRFHSDCYTWQGRLLLVTEKEPYKSCSRDGCNKKVQHLDSGRYRCDKCNKESEDFKWAIVLEATVADFTGHTVCTMFLDQATVLLGITASAVQAMRRHDPDQFQRLLQSLVFNEYSFEMQVKRQIYNNESRFQTTVRGLSKVDPVEHNKRLVREIYQMIEQR